MIGTGKYDFPGIRKLGASALKLALSSTSWGLWLVTGPFKKVFEITSEWVIEWLANKGLLIINIGAIYVSGEFDQAKFDQAMDEGLKRVQIPDLTEEQKKEIDDEVIKAFRNFAVIANKR